MVTTEYFNSSKVFIKCSKWNEFANKIVVYDQTNEGI